MSTLGPSELAVRQGRRRLKAWLPSIRAAAVGASATDLSGKTGLWESVEPYLTEDNLDSLAIYQGELGGWYADLVLKRVPAGVANVIGTPVHRPMKTMAEAEEHGRDLLRMILRLDREKPKECGRPAIIVHGITFFFEQATLDRMEQGARDLGIQTPSKSFSEVRIGEVLDEHFPEGISDAKLRALDAVSRMEFMSVLAMAALTGVLRYPPSIEVTPSGHREAASSRAVN